MMQTSSRNGGFSLVEGILAILILFILAFIGWRVWDTSRSDSSSEDKTGSQQRQENARSTSKSGSGATSNESNTTYLEIPELGVRIPLEGEAGTVVWESDARLAADYPGAKRARFSSQELVTASGGTCDLSRANPLGVLTSFSGATDFLGNDLRADGQRIFYINGTYYLYESPQSPCSIDTAVEALAAKQRDAFVHDIRKIEALRP